MIAPIGYEKIWEELKKRGIINKEGNLLNRLAGSRYTMKMVYEVDGKTVLVNNYDLNVLEKAMQEHDKNPIDKWNPIPREIRCAIKCKNKGGYVACLARCLLDGKACDGGINNCEDV